MGKTIKLRGGVGIGLNDVRLTELAAIQTTSSLQASLHLPAPIQTASSVQVAPITTSSTVDLGLDNIRVTQVAPITTSSTVDLGLDNIRVQQIAPINTESRVELDVRIRELPQIRLELSLRPFRLHLPLNYAFSIELFGVPVFKLSLCGEGMAIHENYVPKETERC